MALFGDGRVGEECRLGTGSGEEIVRKPSVERTTMGIKIRLGLTAEHSH